MPPILFKLQQLRPGGRPMTLKRGVAPFMPAGGLPQGRPYRISGVTRDSTGAALGSVTVQLFRTQDDVFMGETVSDGSGNYSFSVDPGVTNYYIVAYKVGAPDVAGTTANTLKGA